MSHWGVEFTEEDAKVEIATGVHTVVINDISERGTKSGGKAIRFNFQIVKGDKKGLFAEDFINYINANPVAEKIGRVKLDKFAKAIGLSGLTELNKTPIESLKNKILLVELAIKKDDQYGDKSVVKKYIAKGDVKSVSETLPDDSVPF